MKRTELKPNRVQEVLYSHCRSLSQNGYGPCPRFHDTSPKQLALRLLTSSPASKVERRGVMSLDEALARSPKQPNSTRLDARRRATEEQMSRCFDRGW